MARKPTESEITQHQETGLTENASDALDILAVAQSNYNDDRDLVNQVLGQVQMAGAFEEFSRTVRTSKLKFIKDNQLYKNLKGKKSLDGQKILTGTWEEFCSLAGRSYDQINEDINNLNAMGEEALESMSRMGIGYRELRQYRKLPEDQKTALIEVAKAGDKETLVELAEEFIAKNNKEKEALKKENQNLKADYKALDSVNATDKKSIDELKLKLSKYELKLVSIDEQIEELGIKINLNEDIHKPITRVFNELTAGINHLYQLKLNAMENDPDFQQGDVIHLPQIVLDELLKYDGMLIFILDRIRLMHQDFCYKFDANIEEFRARINQAVYENLVEIVE